MRRRPLITALPALAAATPPGWAQGPPAGGAAKILHLVFRSPETSFDPPQTNSDSNTSILLAQDRKSVV